MPRYLTKSRFKLAIDCPPKLYYCNKPNEYADKAIDDSFLAALAQGGFQVGELAKYLFCNDPRQEQITITELDYDKAIDITNEKLFASEKPVIAEAAFRYENLFVRADITIREGNVIKIYEVKAKSWKKDKSFWVTPKRNEPYLDKKWLPYLYDIAFQKYVVQKAFPNYEVQAHMIFADADVEASINGLNQIFRIDKSGNRTTIKVIEGTTQLSLGNIPLKTINVDYECDYIYSHPVQVDLEEEYSFEAMIKLFADAYEKDERIWSHIGRKCKECQFLTTDHGPQTTEERTADHGPQTTDKRRQTTREIANLKSGFDECWKHFTNLSDEQLKKPLTLELWGGLGGPMSIVDGAIKRGKYLLETLDETDYWPNNYKASIGLHPAERRRLQIQKVKDKDQLPYLDREGLKKEFDALEPPYHFIDFETTMVALPFHGGRKPYEAIAFQYSYHLMDEKGRIDHKSQYISINHQFPNYEFVRALKKDLHCKEGTIFRYHKHENTYLRFIERQLLEDKSDIPDKQELVEFIHEITHDKETERCGHRDMQDLWELVLKYYYSPAARGSNSIKDILPAVIGDSEFIRDKYSKPIYGTELIPSLNFQNHTWISEKHGMNPYKTLPKILDGYENDSLDQFFEMDEELRDGGAAMMAYAYLQFTDIPEKQKEYIKNALLRYCELDTMAMVMIWEYFTPRKL